MPETIELETRRLKYKGVMDFEGLLKVINDFLNSNFTKVKETEFKQSPGKIANSLNLEAKYEAYIDWTNYYRRNIKIEVKANDVEEIEVIKDGGKKRADNGRVEIKITANVELDYKDKFKSSVLKRKLRLAHLKIFKMDILANQVKPFDDLIISFIRQIKKTLGMETASEAYQ